MNSNPLPTIAVYIPDAEAKKFLLFKEHFEIFDAMLAHKVFDIGWGKATLHFKDGILQSITKEEVVYRRNGLST